MKIQYQQQIQHDHDNHNMQNNQLPDIYNYAHWQIVFLLCLIFIHSRVFQSMSQISSLSTNIGLIINNLPIINNQCPDKAIAELPRRLRLLLNLVAMVKSWVSEKPCENLDVKISDYHRLSHQISVSHRLSHLLYWTCNGIWIW